MKARWKRTRAPKSKSNKRDLDCSPESFSPTNVFYIFVPLVPTCDPQVEASFDPKGHHMNKIDKRRLGDATYQKSKLYPFQFQRRRILKLVFFVPMFQLVTPRGQFWPHEHHMNKLGRCPQGDAKNQTSKLYTFQFQRKRILNMGFFVPMFQLVTPRVGANLHPRSIIWTNLVEVHQKMLHTKYQSSSPYGLGQEDF